MPADVKMRLLFQVCLIGIVVAGMIADINKTPIPWGWLFFYFGSTIIGLHDVLSTLKDYK